MSKRAIALNGVPEFPPEPEPAVAVTPPATGLGIAHYVVGSGGAGSNLAPSATGCGGGGSYTVTTQWAHCECCGCVTNRVYHTPDDRSLCSACNGMFVAAKELVKAPKSLLGRFASVKHWFGK